MQQEGSVKMYSLETRDSMLLDVTAKMFGLSSLETYNYVQGLFNYFLKILESKNFKYTDFKNILIPQKDRKEILLVFDSRKIEKSDYGTHICDLIITNIPIEVRTSYISGDFIDITKSQEFTFGILSEHFDLSELDFYRSDMFYFVYLNNLSKNQFNFISTMLNKEKSYFGFADMTYGSLLKDYCSFILGSRFVKIGKKIMGTHEDDADTNENGNLCFIDFCKYGYSFKSIPVSYYGLFLSYKIERSIVESDPNDIKNSLIALAGKECNLDLFNLKLRESKHQYLITHKNGVLKRLDFLRLTTGELEDILNEKIWTNYIYNLEYIEDHKVYKFNTMFEFVRKDLNCKVKIQVALNYYHEKNELDVITLY